MKTHNQKTATIICVAITGLMLGQIVAAGPLSAQTQKTGDNDQVLICHNPSGQPGNEQDLWVNANAVQAHLAHGDQLGSCQGPPSAPPAPVPAPPAAPASPGK